MYLNSAGASEVFKTIKSFNNKATRNTKIDALKRANKSFSFTDIIASIVNKSFQEGVCPVQKNRPG